MSYPARVEGLVKIYKQDLSLDNQGSFICCKTQPTNYRNHGRQKKSLITCCPTVGLHCCLHSPGYGTGDSTASPTPRFSSLVYLLISSQNIWILCFQGENLPDALTSRVDLCKTKVLKNDSRVNPLCERQRPLFMKDIKNVLFHPISKNPSLSIFITY